MKLKKARYLGIGCAVLLLVGVLAVLPQGNFKETGQEKAYSYSDETDMHDPLFDCLTGTWKSTSTGDSLTIEKSGATTVTIAGSSYDSDTSDCFFSFLDVTASGTESFEKYLMEKDQDLTQDYPQEDYYYCVLDCWYPQNPPQYDNGIMLCDQYVGFLLYLPREWYDSDEPQKPGTELMVYHRADGSTESYYDSYILQS